MKISNFNITLQYWLSELEKYNYSQLTLKESPTSWSIGQLYVHLLEATTHFFDEIDICLTTNKNQNEQMNDNAKLMFEKKALPNERIAGPPSNAETSQPKSKEEIILAFSHLQNRLAILEAKLPNNTFIGKTKHPGLNYFNATEWYNFTNMHFQHHLRQKQRIDSFLEVQ